MSPAATGAEPEGVPRVEFRARFGRDKTELQRRAPAGTTEALERALAWLAAHQASDGHWSNDHFDTSCGRVGKGSCTGPGGAGHDVGATGLALLAFLGDGHTPTRGEHREPIARGLAWLAQRQDGQGLIGERLSHDYLYDHAIAAAALCEGVGLGAEALRAPAEKAVAFLLLGRHPEGAWRYDVPASDKGDTSMTGWAVNALVAAQRAGLAVDPAALAAALAWFERMTDPRTGRTGYSDRGELSSRTPANQQFPRELGEAMTGVALLSRILLGQKPGSSPVLHEHARLIAARPPSIDEDWGGDLYYWYYGTHALWQMGAPYWDSWAKDLRNALILAQSRRGDEEGSWDPMGPWGYVMGRVCSTALSALTLECCTRYPRYVER